MISQIRAVQQATLLHTTQIEERRSAGDWSSNPLALSTPKAESIGGENF